MNFGLVSIIIPAYNAERYIESCLVSVIGQTYKDLEIIIVNDGSTDSTINVIKKIDDKRIVIIDQKNKGASHAKNAGLAIAKGEFIQFLDSDDILSFDKIESQVTCLMGKKNSIAVCKTIVFEFNFEHGFIEIDTDIIKRGGSGLTFLKRLLGSEGRFAMVQPNAYLITRDIIIKAGIWRTDLYPCPDEDGEFFSRILLNSEDVLFTGGINYYRKEPNNFSLSRTYDNLRAINQLKTTFRKFENLFVYEYSILTRTLFQYNVSQVLYQFGSDYPELLKIATFELRKYDCRDFLLIDGGRFKIVADLIGFKSVIMLRRLIKQIFF